MNIIMRIRQAMPFSDVNIIGEYLSLGDFLLAAITALIVVWIVRGISKRVKFVKMPPEELRNIYAEKMAQWCRLMFPQTTLSFGGQTFTRGMQIRVITRENRTFEGSFIGINEDNAICVMTETKLEADILDNILEIILVDEQG